MFRYIVCSIFIIFLAFLTPEVVDAKEKQPEAKPLQIEERYVLQGFAEINNEINEQDEELFTGETTVVEKGKVLNMIVSNVISSTTNVEGDEFFAEITSDVSTEDGVVIQRGSIAHGVIEDLEASRRLGRDGYVTLKFDYIATPDGREIPIAARMTTKRNPVVQTAKIIGENTLYTLGGGLAGGYMALNMLGIEAAVASQGYTVAGGAAIGGAIGLTAGLVRKGKNVAISVGDTINVKVLGAMKLPVLKNSAIKEEEIFLDGLTVKITNVQVVKDPFGEPNTLDLSMTIVNNTNKTFSSFDMALMNDLKAIYYASPFGDTQMWFTKIPPRARIAGKLSFSVDNPKRKFWLVFYDSYNRKMVAKISVDNAIREIEKLRKDKKKKKRR